MWRIMLAVSDQAPIGVLDSGIGGISVLNEMRKLLPHERFLYVAGFWPHALRAKVG